MTPGNLNSIPECKDPSKTPGSEVDQAARLKQIQENQNVLPSPPPEVTRKRSSSSADLNGESTKLEESASENDASLPVEKKQRVE